MSRSDTPEAAAGNVENLGARLEAVERRLDALERAAKDVARREPEIDEPEASAVATGSPAETIALVGRTLLVLAGAYAFRSLTESGALPALAGVGSGLAYALFWLVLADRAAGSARTASAIFHALAASAIAFPLLWENATKFGVLAPATAAAGIIFFAVASLAVAWRRELPALAWIATSGAIAAAAALAVTAKSLAPAAVVMVVLGAATLWAGPIKRWHGIAPVAAIAALGTIALMTLVLLLGRSPRVEELVPPAALAELQIALVLVYLGSPVVRALRSRAATTLGEIALAVPAGIVGVGGAMLSAHAAGRGSNVIGAVAAVLASGCYAVSFATLDRSEGSRVGFIFYTTAALALSISALALLVGGPALPLALCVAAAASAWFGFRRERATLSLHASVFLAAAGVASGVVLLSARALLRIPPPAASAIALPMLAAVATSVFVAALPVASHGRTWGRLSRLPKLLVVSLAIFCACGLTTVLGATLLPAGAHGGVDAASLAVLRTATLAAAAVVLALASRLDAILEAGWLVYPILAAGGLKLLVEDFRVGRPGALVLSFALLGGALILAPRLGRRRAAG